MLINESGLTSLRYVMSASRGFNATAWLLMGWFANAFQRLQYIACRKLMIPREHVECTRRKFDDLTHGKDSFAKVSKNLVRYRKLLIVESSK